VTGSLSALGGIGGLALQAQSTCSFVSFTFPLPNLADKLRPFRRTLLLVLAIRLHMRQCCQLRSRSLSGDIVNENATENSDLWKTVRGGRTTSASSLDST
jgi:hypothetical protein